MYTHHPLYTENFNFDIFMEENENIIKDLYQEAKLIVTGSSVIKNEITENRACLISMAVFNELESFADSEGMDLDDEEEDPILEKFFKNMIVQTTLFDMEESGIVKGDKGQYSLTPLGIQRAKRVAKKHKILNEE